VQLGLGGAAGAFEDTCNFSVIESVDVVKEEDAAIAGRHGSNGAIDVQAIDDSGLR
jgi:hypothetical protein